MAHGSPVVSARMWTFDERFPDVRQVQKGRTHCQVVPGGEDLLRRKASLRQDLGTAMQSTNLAVHAGICRASKRLSPRYPDGRMA